VPVELKDCSDSLSYAAGKMVTDGLVNYLVKQQGVDTAYMADFIEGFKEAVNAADDARKKARLAGIDIAGQVLQRMLPGMKNEFTDTPDSIINRLFFRGFTDALQGDTTVMQLSESIAFFQQKQQSNKAAKEEKLYGANREAGKKFLAENKLKEGVITTPSGLQYKVLKQGEGAVPQRTDKVKVHYEGRLVDGTVFDASTKHGTEPATFRADQVIKGWTEALTMMPVGSKWQLYIPYQLAYGDRNTGNIKPFSALIFDVELLGIEK
jgi:FKBP-type peptidyl-prolyl cis-trans isomerase FklB